MNVVATMMVLFSVLVPAKLWYSPEKDKPVEIQVKAAQPMRLILVDFSGKVQDPAISNVVNPNINVDIRKIYPQVDDPGTYVLLAVAQGRPATEFLGTPLVIQALTPPKSSPIGAKPDTNVIKISPLCYVRMDTTAGLMKILFWYDVAPNTVGSFLSLSAGGFYDGLSFHRIIPGFVVQGGDPLGNGMGGPGYNLAAEFSDRPHDVGVISMARNGDPLEGKGMPPRVEYANTAGSQFFLCLTREQTKALDRKYTGFGQIFDGLDVLQKLGGTELADPASGKPKVAPYMTRVQVVPVTPGDNPYADMLKLATIPQPQGAATTR
jgi:peptidyl-prolyl cis-trans isomerase B (cyclophilin B)